MIQDGKPLSVQHAMKVANAKITQSSERIGWFRPITVRAVLLYNVLLKMRKTRVGYNFSLLWVICILLTVIRDDEGLLVSENMNDDEQKKESSKKKKKTKHVDRTASSLAAMVYATIISRDDYLSKFKSKAAKETNNSSKNEEDDSEVKVEDKDEPEETIYQMQVKKIQEAVDLLTERIIQDAGMGMFLEDHTSFATAICIEILGFSDEDKYFLSRSVSAFSPEEYCDLYVRIMMYCVPRH